MNWDETRDQFPVTRHWAFLDHAAVAPLPELAARAITEYAIDLSRHGIAAYSTWANRVRETRELAARLLNADADDVVFVKNTTDGIVLVAEGFPWQAGDNVVTAAEEYPSNQYPWMNLRSRGVEVRAVPSRGNRVAIDDIRAAMDGRTRIVTLSFVEFASGFRNDLTALGSLCRERNVLFFVDAIQGLGILPFDVRQLPVDFLAADSHKWMLGPEGAGLFWIRRELVDRLHPVGVGWNSVIQSFDFSTIDLRLKPHGGRWEGGSYNVAGLVGMGASLKLLLDFGMDSVARRVRALTDHLCEAIQRAGLTVFSSRDGADWSGIVSIQGLANPQAVMRTCREAGVIVNCRAGRIRLSPHCYNTTNEIDHAVSVIAKGTRS